MHALLTLLKKALGESTIRDVADALAGSSTRTAQTTMQLTDLCFKAGAASSFDVLEAQRSLFTAQQAMAQALQLQNLVTLYKVMGGGWTESAAEQK